MTSNGGNNQYKENRLLAMPNAYSHGNIYIRTVMSLIINTNKIDGHAKRCLKHKNRYNLLLSRKGIYDT